MPLHTRHTGRHAILRPLALSAVAGLLAAALATGTLGLFPPKLQSNQLSTAAATVHVFVDTVAPTVVSRDDYPVSAQIQRATMYGELVTSDSLLERIGGIAHIPRSEIESESRTSANVPWALSEPASEQRAAMIANSGRPYRIEAESRQNTPVLDIYTRAPTANEAKRLAAAAVTGLQGYLGELAAKEQIPAKWHVHLRQLGPVRGGSVGGGLPLGFGLLTFVFVTGTVFGVLWFIRRRRELAVVERVLPSSDDWPRTTRMLPWTLAGFIAVLWLVPFNQIQLTVNTPIDLKFDRLILPFVALTWMVAALVGGRLAPRFRPTAIHAAVGGFVVVAFASVIVDAQYLSRTLELDEALKQLPLLLAYVSLFLMISTGLRPSEIRAFLQYTVILAVVCAVGVLYEYRFKHNLFYEWSATLLPHGIFSVETLDTQAVDNIGRRMVRGPAALPLETVAMLAMALPVALVSAVHAKSTRDRLLYGFAACLILAAAFATFRKSALLGPLAVIATVAYFRRRELLKLAPLGLVLIVIIHIAAPGALGKTTSQFDPSRLGVTTVSDRAADYDAVRPDFWTHLALGRGWGGHDHNTYRILDSEFLHRLLEMGLLGLVVYVAMMISVVVGTRKIIAARDATWAPLALMGAAAAISFLVVSALFDVLAFPHATYIFMYSAGLTATVVAQGRAGASAAVRFRSLRRPWPREVGREGRAPAALPRRLRVATRCGSRRSHRLSSGHSALARTAGRSCCASHGGAAAWARAIVTLGPVVDRPQLAA